MTHTYLWLIVIIIGILTFALRFSFIFLLGKIQLPLLMQRALRLVPATVIPALIFPAFFYQNDTLKVSLGNERLLAGIFAALIAWRTQNALLTIVFGMIALWILQAINLKD